MRIKEKVLTKRMERRLLGLKGSYVNDEDRNMEIHNYLMSFKIGVESLYFHEFIDRKTYENVNRLIENRLKFYSIDELEKQIPLFEDGSRNVCVEIDGESKIISVIITSSDNIADMRSKTDYSTVIGRGKVMDMRNVMVVNIDTKYYGFMM